MKKINILGVCLMALFATACSETWDEHYTEEKLFSNQLVVFDGTIDEYIHTQSDLSAASQLFDKENAFENMDADGGYTVIISDNEHFKASNIANVKLFVNNSISDMAMSPSKLHEGAGIYTRFKKNVWVYEKSDGTYLDDFAIQKMVKTNNGYIYVIDGLLQVRFSAYEYFENLGEEYSIFKELVRSYENHYFDAGNSTPAGVDEMGNTYYSDSVIGTSNSLMDRYTRGGLPAWNMRSEHYLTTMFIPTNEVIANAIKNAIDSIPSWLNREATKSDTLKFQEWIVKACFVNARLLPEEVATDGKDIDCVGYYYEKIDKAQDARTYEEAEPALWRPSIQLVDAENPIPLSNGMVYKVNFLKIPNHVVIYRVKTKFYQIWSIMSQEQKDKYFRWSHWTSPLVVNDAQGSFTLSGSMPTMYYHVLTAIPDEEAIADKLKCNVTYDGLLYNTETGSLVEANLPAGEYYLRMGFKHSITYCLSIYFNGKRLVENMSMAAQGSNFHFDRGGASDLEYYGSMSIGYPEGFDWRYWYEKDPKSVAYDTDGYTVGIVNIPKNGNFTIKIESTDMAYIYNSKNGRTAKNITQLMMYHWCLRPTRNNY